MIAVSIKQLVTAIAEAGAFTMPAMNEGTGYLYRNLYSRLSRGEVITLSSLDFDAFEPEDIDTLNSLHEGVFECNSHTADGIMSTLRHIAPVCKAVGYV